MFPCDGTPAGFVVHRIGGRSTPQGSTRCARHPWAACRKPGGLVLVVNFYHSRVVVLIVPHRGGIIRLRGVAVEIPVRGEPRVGVAALVVSRVLTWIFERVEGRTSAMESPIGLLPTPGAIDTSGLSIDDADLQELLSVDARAWLQDIPAIRAHYAKFGDAIPAALQKELADLEARLQAAAK